MTANKSRGLSVVTIDGAIYTLDSAGNRRSKADELANVTTNYGYDGPSAGLTVADPDAPGWNLDWDPSGPPQPHPSFGIGAGGFAGVGYTWCW